MSQAYPIPTYGAPYQDRRAQLLFCGVLEILMGLLSCGMTLLLAASVSLVLSAQGSASSPGGVGRSPELEPASVIPGLLVYGAGAVFFIWMGIGTIQLRRWAQALMLVISSLWLAVGVGGMIASAWYLPKLRKLIDSGGSSGGEMVLAIAGCVLFGLYVILPGMLVLLYRGEDVRRTVEASDPYSRWTDRCPPPVLALCVILAYCSLSSLFFLVTPAPFFGRHIAGLPAVALALVLAPTFGWLAREVYRQRRAGWWGSLLLLGLGGVSYALSFRWEPMAEMYRGMGYGEDQIALMKSWLPVPELMWGTLAATAVLLASVAWLRRYFAPAPAP